MGTNRPEDVQLNQPRRFIESLKLVVCVYDLNAPDDAPPERTEHMDYGNANDRQWLGRLTAWAVQNGRAIETMSKEDWEKLNK